MSGLRCYLRNPDFTRGTFIDDFINFKPIPRFNAVGNWSLTLNWKSRAAQEALSEDGYGIIVTRDRKPFLSGPLDVPKRSWKARGGNVVNLSGPDDNCWLAWRLVLPCDPTGDAGPIYDVSPYHFESGNRETVMRDYVTEHLGSGASIARQLANFTSTPNTTLGGTVSEQGRFQTLLLILQRCAWNLGFRMQQVGDELEFDVYEPVDRSNEVIFSPSFGNLESFDYEVRGPVANYVIVAGGGELMDRVFAEGGDAASIAKWGRREILVDRRDTTDPDVLDQALQEKLVEFGERRGLSISPYEAQPDWFGGDYRQYLVGRDFNPGDKISVIVDGVRIVDQVLAAEVEHAGRVRKARPLLGSLNGQDPNVPDIYEKVRKLDQRVGNMEVR